MDFGRPFDNLGPDCLEFGTIEKASYDTLVGRGYDSNNRLLTNFAGGPIYTSSALFGGGLTVGGLLKGGHELDIDCFQEASDTESGGYKFSAGVVIIITIVHHSPDEMKNLQHMLEGLIGKEAPANPAILMFAKANGGRAYGGVQPHTYRAGCGGTTS
jgi:hypothetical protein